MAEQRFEGRFGAFFCERSRTCSESGTLSGSRKASTMSFNEVTPAGANQAITATEVAERHEELQRSRSWWSESGLPRTFRA